MNVSIGHYSHKGQHHGELQDPYKLNTDNATPFNSQDFANFAKHKGLEHTKITPYALGANDTVDHFMRNLWKVLKTSHINNHNWKTTLQCFLCLYGTTLHCITEYPLTQLLFNKTQLPNLTINTDLLQHKEVTEINGSKITGTNKMRTIKRHITFFKRYILASNQHQEEYSHHRRLVMRETSRTAAGYYTTSRRKRYSCKEESQRHLLDLNQTDESQFDIEMNRTVVMPIVYKGHRICYVRYIQGKRCTAHSSQ